MLYSRLPWEVKQKMNKRGKKGAQEQLRKCQEEYEQIKARIHEVGFICKGSLIERRLTCGNPNCRCHRDSKNLHGPYYQISWKEKGKSVSYFLSPEKAHIYRQWIDNQRELKAILDKMLDISRQAGDCIRARGNLKDTADKGRKKNGRSKKKTT